MADKALLVGINKYPGAPLSGCVNDDLDMAHFVTLAEKCGFDPKTVRLLTDERATTKEILSRLDWLVSDLAPGDRILFQYSGHGAQVATRS
ncbi:MAG: caspase family protein, partial [Bacteroidota bacterium]